MREIEEKEEVFFARCVRGDMQRNFGVIVRKVMIESETTPSWKHCSVAYDIDNKSYIFYIHKNVSSVKIKGASRQSNLSKKLQGDMSKISEAEHWDGLIVQDDESVTCTEEDVVLKFNGLQLKVPYLPDFIVDELKEKLQRNKGDNKRKRRQNVPRHSTKTHVETLTCNPNTLRHTTLFRIISDDTPYHDVLASGHEGGSSSHALNSNITSLSDATNWSHFESGVTRKCQDTRRMAEMYGKFLIDAKLAKRKASDASVECGLELFPKEMRQTMFDKIDFDVEKENAAELHAKIVKYVKESAATNSEIGTYFKCTMSLLINLFGGGKV